MMPNVAMMALVIREQRKLFASIFTENFHVINISIDNGNILNCHQRYCDMRSACSVVSSPSVACNHELLQKGIGSASCKNACDIFKCCWEEHGCFSTHQSECLVAMKVCET